MKLRMRGPQSDWTEALWQHAERRLHFALGRFSQSIGLVTARMLDDSDAHAGCRKTCRIVVNLLPAGRIAVEDTQKDPYIAIDEAAECAGRAVGRQLRFQRELGEDSVRSTIFKGDA